MKASLVLIALSMVVSMSLATTVNSTCPANQTLTCTQGKLVGNLCYGECPQGYFATDSDATPTDDEVDGYYPGPHTYCWQECYGDVYQTYDTTTCGNYSAYGTLSTIPSYGADLSDLYYPNKTSCDAGYPQGCEFCSGEWVPVNDCGAPSCSMFCPVQCPSGMKQINEFACQKNSMKRPVVGEAKCGAGNPNDESTSDSSDESSSDDSDE